MCILYAYGGEKMINARITIDNETNRLINIVKAKYGLKDKSQAIDKFFELYKDDIDENWEVRKSYLNKLEKIKKQTKKDPGKTYTSVEDLNDIFEGVT